ncbi:MAG: hypothetical protein ACOCP8_01665 [archaeon]
MSKMDITRSKSMTIATEKFGNIKPSISITIKDIPIEKIDNASANLEDIIDNLFKIEVAQNNYYFQKIKKEGLDNFTENVFENINDIIQDLEKSMDNLIKVTREEKF